MQKVQIPITLLTLNKEAFSFLKRRAKELFFLSTDDDLPEASVQQTTSPAQASSASGPVEHNQHELHIEQVPVPPEVKVAFPQNRDWPLVLIGFFLASALDISLHSIQTNANIPLCLQFLSFSILLAFASLFLARFVTFHHTMLPQMLEKSGVFFAITAFFIALNTCFHLFLKLISWTIYALSLLAIIIYRSP